MAVMRLLFRSLLVALTRRSVERLTLREDDKEGV